MKLHKIAFVLLIIGGINWLLVALGYGIGELVNENVAMVLYVLIGLAAIYEILSHNRRCKECVGKSVM